MNDGDHVRHNREFWDADSDSYQAVHGRELTAAPFAWGAYRAPEDHVGALGPAAKGALDGLRVVDLSRLVAGNILTKVLSDHGALSFCDPEVILAECARVLAPGGVLAFCVTHPLLVLTWDADRERQSRRLHRSWNTLGRMDWGDGGTIDWVLTASEWIGTLTDAGFVVEACTELVAPTEATTTYTEFAPPKWAKRWPAEWVWRARRR